jgi:hypothetical protein
MNCGRFECGLSHGMVFGMATTKVTITLPNDQLEGIRALVAAGQAARVSAALLDDVVAMAYEERRLPTRPSIAF